MRIVGFLSHLYINLEENHSSWQTLSSWLFRPVLLKVRPSRQCFYGNLYFHLFIQKTRTWSIIPCLLQPQLSRLFFDFRKKDILHSPNPSSSSSSETNQPNNGSNRTRQHHLEYLILLLSGWSIRVRWASATVRARAVASVASRTGGSVSAT